jgi:hypothetical protein
VVIISRLAVLLNFYNFNDGDLQIFNRVHLAKILLRINFVSFVLGVLLSNYYPLLSYYNFPSIAWGMLVGALAF